MPGHADYYDRCYDHELEREERRSIDLTGLDPEQSADQLLRDQLISPTRAIGRRSSLKSPLAWAELPWQTAASSHSVFPAGMSRSCRTSATRSRDGRTGQAKFVFEEPQALAPETLGDIAGMWMVDEEGSLVLWK